MFDARRRPKGRLFHWWVAVATIAGAGLNAWGAAAVPQSGPGSSTVADIVYMADGSFAAGTLIITWPAFVTAGGSAVAGGTTNVTLGANGALSVALVPNAGATPANSYYTVVYQLGPGEVRTEYWIVPTTSPANLATVRTTPGTGVATQPASMEYVNSELAAKANDSAVVHLSGTETISGAKTFAAAPSVPTPTSAGQVATKGYVDQSVSNAGAGNYLPTAGGTMSGPITLPSNPTAPLQAATKQYVDLGASTKADLVSGMVPASELGTGTSSAGTCLFGNGTWSACGSGAAGVANGAALVSNGVGQAGIYQTKAIADVADYPAVVPDGSTDNCASFQAFINANPGKRLIVRKVGAATEGGDSASTVDYYSSCTFHLTYNGTVIEGNANEMWQGAPVFLFAAGVTGFQIDPSCMGCAIRDIEEVGGGKPAYNAAACYSSGNALVYPFTGAADGVLVYGGEPTLEHVEANCNPRDGIHIDGTNVVVNGFAGQPDVWEVKGGQGNANFHNNLYIHGGDSNAGIETRFMAYNAGGWGFEDDAALGNTHISSFTTANGRDAGIAAGTTASISSISCSSYTCSVVAATAVAGIQKGIWIAISGTTNHNGVFYVTGYTDAKHFSFTWVAPTVVTETTGSVGVDGSTHMFANALRSTSDATCAAGQSTLYSQSAQFGKDTQVGGSISVAGAGTSGALLNTTIASVINEYSVQLATNCLSAVSNSQIGYGGGISHGPFMSNGGSIANTWITPYWEADQPPSKMTVNNYVVGGDMSFNYSYGIPVWLTSNGAINTETLVVNDPADGAGGFQTQCGATGNQDCGLDIFNYNQSAHWKLYAVGSSSDQAFWIRDESSGGDIPFQANHGGATNLTASTNITLTPGAGYLNVFYTGTEFANITGLTQCLQVNSLGVVSGTGAACGSGGGGMTWPTTAGLAVATGGSTWGTSVGSVVPVPAGSTQSAIQAILSAAVAGQEIWFSGTYSACGLTVSAPYVRLRGLDTDGTVIACSTASSPVLTVSGSGDEVSGLNLKHVTNSPTCPGGNGTSTCGDGLQVAGGATRVKIENVHTNFNYNGIALGWTTYGEYSNSISEFNNNHGVVFVMSATSKNMQWQVSRILSEQNLGNGFDMTCPSSFVSVQTPGPYITGWSAAFGNEGYGYNFSCSGATTSGIADVWMSDVFASQNNQSGIRADLGPNGGRNFILNNVYSEQAGTYAGTAGFASATQNPTNAGYGVEITSSCDSTPAPIITGGLLWSNSFSGASASCAGTSFANVDSDNNGVAAASTQTEAGITINAGNVSVTGGFHKKTSYENYGVYVLSGDTPSITGPVCDGSITTANCIFAAAQPPNGFQEWVGQAKHITGSGVPAMACTNGWIYERTDAGNFPTEYSCVNGVWMASGTANGLAASATVGTTAIAINSGCAGWTLGAGWSCSAGTLVLAAQANQGTASYHAPSLQSPGNIVQLTLSGSTNFSLDIEHCGAAITPLTPSSPTVSGQTYTYTCSDTSDLTFVPSGTLSQTTATISSVAACLLTGGNATALNVTTPSSWTGVRNTSLPNFVNYPLNGTLESPVVRSSTALVSVFEGGAGTEWVTAAGTAPVNDSTHLNGNNQSIDLASTNAVASRMDKVFTSTKNFSGAVAVRLVFYLDNPANLSVIQCYLSNSDYASYYISSFYPNNGIYNLASQTIPGWYEATWPISQFSSVGTPTLASVDRIRLGVLAGTSATVNVSFARLELIYPTLPKSTIVLSFDDGFASQFTTVRGILAQYGWGATAFVVPGYLGTSNYMQLSQVQQLQNLYSWDVGNHTYSHAALENDSAAAMDNEFNLWENWAQTNNIHPAPVVAYPYGLYSSSTITEAGKYALMARSIEPLQASGETATYDPRSWQYDLPSYLVNGPSTQTTLATAEGWINSAVANPNSLTILTFHNIIPSPVTSTDWDTADFTALMAYIATQNVNVWNFTQLANYYWPQATLPPAGVANSTGSAWGTPYQVGTSAGDLLALDSGANLTLPDNLTVNGQLSVAGPWLINTAPASSAMGAAATGKSSFGISNDGNFYISANAGTPGQIVTQTQAGSTTPNMDGTAAAGSSASWARADHVHPTDTSRAPLASPTFTGTPAAPTQTAHDNSTKLATDAYVDGTYTATWTPLGNSFSTTAVGFNTTTGHMNVFGVLLRTPVYTCNMTAYIATADNSTNTYDIGLYQGTASGTENLLAHTGAVAGSSYATANATYTTVPWTGCVFLAPGRYYLALYANVASAAMTLGEDGGSVNFYHLNGAAITPVSGGLPATYSSTTDGAGFSQAPYLMLH